jgi:hypothetical protein
LGKKAKHVLTLVSDGGSRAKLQVSKKTEDLVVRDILKALKGLSEDNYVYAQEHIDPGRTIGDWVSVTEELRSNICKTLIDLANKCEDLAVNVGEVKKAKTPKQSSDQLLRDLATGLVNTSSHFGQLRGLLGARPKG